jgi:polyphosphate kinase
LLQFQRRVLEEAQDARNPLLERVKFLSILNSNLDEFFMVRVAGLLQQIENGVNEPGIDGRSPAAQLEAIRLDSTSLMQQAYAAYRSELVPRLADAGIHVSDYRSLNETPKAVARNLFPRERLPGTNAVGIRSGAPLPAHIESEPEFGGGGTGCVGR